MGIFGGLYPSIAVSDAFNSACHVFVAKICYDSGLNLAALGFMSVAVAATVGVYRFGFDENFAQANADLADLAAFVGLPMVGMEFLLKHTSDTFLNQSNALFVIFALLFFEAFTRSMKKSAREFAKTLTNIIFFVLPIVAISAGRQDWKALFGIASFVVAAVVITPNRQKYILGVRCENWFHYIIAVSAYLIASGLPVNM